MRSTLDDGHHAVAQSQSRPRGRMKTDIFRANYSFLFMGIQEGNDTRNEEGRKKGGDKR